MTRELRVDETWHPQSHKARVGDAFTRTVTLMASDVPGMMFPALPLIKMEGLAVYPKPPSVQDQVERGDLTGKRTETVTYMCERPGQYTLPALVIPWWDLKNHQLMRVTLPAVTLEVDPVPCRVVTRRRQPQRDFGSHGCGGFWAQCYCLSSRWRHSGTSDRRSEPRGKASASNATRVSPVFLLSCSTPVVPATPGQRIMLCCDGWMFAIVDLTRRPSKRSLPAIRMRTSGVMWRCFRRLSWARGPLGRRGIG